MNHWDLLNRSFSCSCGREHTFPVRAFLYTNGLAEQIPFLLRENGVLPDQTRIVIVADKRTREVYGETVWKCLGEFRNRSFCLVPDRYNSDPVCDRDTMRWLKEQVGEKSADFLLAVGSGVINDLCKWASFELDLPYGVIATAASMNGYAAANVAPTIDGVKVLIRARPPVFVGADPSVIEHAPFDMTEAGFGDTLAKFMSGADWWMNHFLFDEYYCGFCSGMLDSIEQTLLARPEKIAQQDPEALRTLFEALFWSGAAMTLVGSSAPASGGEHLLSHTLDMVSSIRHGRHDLHGRQVGLGTIFSAALYERILSIEDPVFVVTPDQIDPDYWAQPNVISAVAEQYEQKKLFFETSAEKLSFQENWKILRNGLKNKVKSPVQIRQLLKTAGAAYTVEQIGCTRQQFLQAVVHMHEIRKRFTVVDLAWLLGILPGEAEEIVDHYMME